MEDLTQEMLGQTVGGESNWESQGKLKILLFLFCSLHLIQPVVNLRCACEAMSDTVVYEKV